MYPRLPGDAAGHGAIVYLRWGASINRFQIANQLIFTLAAGYSWGD
jgi:hypothetical protein